MPENLFDIAKLNIYDFLDMEPEKQFDYYMAIMQGKTVFNPYFNDRSKMASILLDMKYQQEINSLKGALMEVEAQLEDLKKEIKNIKQHNA